MMMIMPRRKVIITHFKGEINNYKKTMQKSLYEARLARSLLISLCSIICCKVIALFRNWQC